MTTSRLLVLSSLLALAACSAGAEGDACTSDEDCGEGLECHVEHDDHDSHEDGDSGEEHDDHEEGEEGEEGVCEAEGEDHEGHDHD